LSGQPTDVGSDSSQYDNLDRNAKPGAGGAAFVVVMQTADVRDGHDPGLQSMHRPLEIGIVYAPATRAAFGLIWVFAGVAGDRKGSLQINGPQ
jgi:hypothetical protein